MGRGLLRPLGQDPCARGEPGAPSAGHRHPVPPRRGRWVQPGVKSPGGGTGFPFPLPPLLQGAAGARGPSQTPPGTPRAGSGLPDTGTPLPLRPGALHPPSPPALCPPVASGPPPGTSQPCAPRWHRVPPRLSRTPGRSRDAPAAPNRPDSRFPVTPEPPRSPPPGGPGPPRPPPAAHPVLDLGGEAVGRPLVELGAAHGAAAAERAPERGAAAAPGGTGRGGGGPGGAGGGSGPAPPS